MASNEDPQLEAYEDDDVAKPVGRGIAALLAVAIGIGLLFGGGVLVMTKVVGLGGKAASGSGSASPTASLYMPDPKPTTDPKAKPTPQPSESQTPDKPTIKVTGPATAAAGSTITFTGTYPQGVGSVLMVERKEGDSWAPFGSSGVFVTVKPDGSFTTWISTSRTGAGQFRLTDQDKQLSSNEVTVTIG